MGLRWVRVVTVRSGGREGADQRPFSHVPIMAEYVTTTDGGLAVVRRSMGVLPGANDLFADLLHRLAAR